MSPKVSVLVPIYNVERYLSQCLDSLKNQSLKDIEIICINDGSTDKSSEIIDQYAAEDERFVVIHKTNSGYGHSMNMGLSKATGEYIGIVEPDDWADLRMFEDLYNHASKYKLDIVKAEYAEVYEDRGDLVIRQKKTIKDPSWYKKVLRPNDTKQAYYFVMMNGLGIFNREFLKNTGIQFHETPGAAHQDLGFWFLSFAYADRVMFIPGHYYMYRQDNPNSSINNRGTKYKCICDEYDYIRHMLDKLGGERKEQILDVYTHRKFLSLDYFYTQLADSYKILFLEYMRDCFARDEKENWFDSELKCFSSKQRDTLGLMCKDPVSFFQSTLYKDTDRFIDLMTENRKLKEELAQALANELIVNQKNPFLVVSVIMPVYNTSQYLAASMDSILGQSMANLELICIDDGSTDDSLTILNKYQALDSRVRVISTVNQGQGAARNIGIEMAQGKYIYFMDSDDLLVKDALSVLTEKAEKTGSQIVYFDAEPFYESDHLKKKFSSFERAYLRKHSYKECVSGEDMFLAMTARNEFYVQPCCQLISTDYLKSVKIKFKNNCIYEDNYFTVLSMLRAKSVSHINKAFFKRRIRENSTMTGAVTIRNLWGWYRAYVDIMYSVSQLHLTEKTQRAVIKFVSAFKGQFVKHARLYWDKSERATYFDTSDIELCSRLFFNTNVVYQKGKLSQVWRPVKQFINKIRGKY